MFASRFRFHPAVITLFLVVVVLVLARTATATRGLRSVAATMHTNNNNNNNNNAERNRNLAIGGDDVTDPDEYPYFAELEYYPSEGQICGGLMISPTVLLTAAHCIPKDQNVWMNAYVGYNTRGYKEFLHAPLSYGGHAGACQHPDGCNCVTHPSYVQEEYLDNGSVKPGTGSTGGNDFAVCHLYGGTSVDIDESEVFLELNRDDEFPPADTELTTMGYGYTIPTGYTSPEEFQNLILQDVDLISYGSGSSETCDQFYGGGGLITESMVCAYDGNITDSDIKAECRGDSGGPLVYKELMPDGRTKHLAVGVVSFSGGCGVTPGVFGRISSVADWIEETVCTEWGEDCPTSSPSNSPSIASVSTEAPSERPSGSPSISTSSPTSSPTDAPSDSPSASTSKPTSSPSLRSTPVPSQSPSDKTAGPTPSTRSPSDSPSTASPSASTNKPSSQSQTQSPSRSPSLRPSAVPSQQAVNDIDVLGPDTTSPSASPTDSPGTSSPSASPSKPISQSPSSSPSLRPSLAPSKAPITANECPSDIIMVGQQGTTELPEGSVRILAQNTTHATVELRQLFTSSPEQTIDGMYYQYQHETFSTKCFEEAEVPGQQRVTTITMACTVHNPHAELEIWIADDASKSFLSALEDTAVVPECCHPSQPEGTPATHYSLAIKCVTDCPEATQ